MEKMLTRLTNRWGISFKLILLSGFVLVICIFSLLSYYTYQNSMDQLQFSHLETHSNEVLLNTERLLDNLFEAETSQRGFLITDDSSFLISYLRALDSINYPYNVLRKLTADNLVQQAILNQLDSLIAQRLQSLKETLGLRIAGGFELSRRRVLSLRGSMLMADIKQQIINVQQIEEKLLTDRKENNVRQVAAFNYAYMISSAIIGIILIGLFLIIYMNLKTLSQVNQSLQKSLNEITDYRTALDASSIVAITDPKGIIHYVNDQFCTISKHSREELLGQDHKIINSGFHGNEFIRELWVTISNGKVWIGDIRNKAKDGTIYWVATTIVPFRNQQGNPYQYMSICTDITSLKVIEAKIQHLNQELEQTVRERTNDLSKANEALVRNIELLNDMSEVATLGGWEIDLEDMTTHWTDEVYRIHELAPNKTHTLEESINYYAPNAQPTIKEAINQAITKGKGWDMELPFITAKEAHLWVRVIGKSAFQDGKAVRVYGTLQDITERKSIQNDIKRLNESLEQKVEERTKQLQLVNQELESFTYSVSHDLRAPLRSINGYAAVLTEEYTAQLDGEGNRLLGIVISNAKRMDQLIDDLLAFSRLGKQPLSKTSVNMDELVKQIADGQVDVKNGHKIELIINPLGYAMADANMLRQVWVNLLSNALKYSNKKERSIIEIGSLKGHSSGKIYFVKDNGVGFDMAYIHKLFGVFQRLHKATEFEGTGVGLALVKRIIDKHEGQIWAEAAIDVGATFYFTLP